MISFGATPVRNGSVRAIEYDTGVDAGPLGAVAAVDRPGAEIWWDAQDVPVGKEEGSVGELPWTRGHGWDARLGRWAEEVAIRDGPEMSPK